MTELQPNLTESFKGQEAENSCEPTTHRNSTGSKPDDKKMEMSQPVVNGGSTTPNIVPNEMAKPVQNNPNYPPQFRPLQPQQTPLPGGLRPLNDVGPRPHPPNLQRIDSRGQLQTRPPLPQQFRPPLQPRIPLNVPQRPPPPRLPLGQPRPPGIPPQRPLAQPGAPAVNNFKRVVSAIQQLSTTPEDSAVQSPPPVLSRPPSVFPQRNIPSGPMSLLPEPDMDSENKLKTSESLVSKTSDLGSLSSSNASFEIDSDKIASQKNRSFSISVPTAELPKSEEERRRSVAFGAPIPGDLKSTLSHIPEKLTTEPVKKTEDDDDDVVIPPTPVKIATPSPAARSPLPPKSPSPNISIKSSLNNSQEELPRAENAILTRNSSKSSIVGSHEDVTKLRTASSPMPPPKEPEPARKEEFRGLEPKTPDSVASITSKVTTPDTDLDSPSGDYGKMRAKSATPSRASSRAGANSADSLSRNRYRTTSARSNKEGDNDSGVDESTQGNECANGDMTSPRKSTKIPQHRVSSPNKTPSRSKTPRTPKTPDQEPKDVPLIKKVPMNKIQVGSAPSPNLKTVRSKIGSLDNASYKPGGGKVKIEQKKIDFTTVKPRIAAKNDTYVSKGGDKKITQIKLKWDAKSKVGSLDNATHQPGGGDKKIETVKLDFKDKAKPKVASKDNLKHQPQGGDVKIEQKKLDFKAQSKVGSLDNVKYKPGGGSKKIFDDKEYLKQMSGQGGDRLQSGNQSPVPSEQGTARRISDPPASDENLNRS